MDHAADRDYARLVVTLDCILLRDRVLVLSQRGLGILACLTHSRLVSLITQVSFRNGLARQNLCLVAAECVHS